MPPPSSRAADWLEIAVEVAGIDAETVADTLRQHCPGGVAIEPTVRPRDDGYVVDGDAPALVKGYLPPGANSVRVRRSLRLALRFAPLERLPRWREVDVAAEPPALSSPPSPASPESIPAAGVEAPADPPALAPAAVESAPAVPLAAAARPPFDEQPEKNSSSAIHAPSKKPSALAWL